MPVTTQIMGPLGPLSQQGIDAYGLQREIGINRRTEIAGTGYEFPWILTIYLHPGIRNEIEVARSKRRIGDRRVPEPPLSVLKLAKRFEKLAKRERDWFAFHNYALWSSGPKGIQWLLKRFGV